MGDLAATRGSVTSARRNPAAVPARGSGRGETFTDIARFGEKKLELLRRFRPYRDGTPAHDHLGDIFATLDAQAFQRCFVAWVAALTKTPAEVIAIDGKTSRRSYQKKGSKEPIHMVSAFAARQRLVLGQVEGERKVQRDRRHSRAARHDGDRGRRRHHRRDGLSARHRQENHRQEGRLHPRAERQSGNPARGCRGLRRRAESQWISRIRRSAGTRRSTAITAVSKPEPTR